MSQRHCSENLAFILCLTALVACDAGSPASSGTRSSGATKKPAASQEQAAESAQAEGDQAEAAKAEAAKAEAAKAEAAKAEAAKAATAKAEAATGEADKAKAPASVGSSFEGYDAAKLTAAQKEAHKQKRYGAGLIGGEGGDVAEQVCEKGYLIGLQVQTGKFVDKVIGYCSDGTQLAFGDGTEVIQDYYCEDSAMKGLSGNGGDSVDALSVKCLDNKASNLMAGHSGGGSPQSSLCPEKYLAVGLRVSSGDWIDRLQVICGKFGS